MPTRIQLSRRKGWRLPPDTVVCSRPGRYGNPWVVEYSPEIGRYVVRRPKRYPRSVTVAKTMGRTEAVAIALRLYRYRLRWKARLDPAFLDPIRKATHAACWCPPSARCHVDVILEELEGAAP